MPAARVFTELRIWQAARDWQKAIYPHTRTKPFQDDFRLVAQINDSADSVMANIAEGFGRGTQGEFVQFLGYSIGSLNETQSHLVVAYDRDFITQTDYAHLFEDGTKLRKSMVKFLGSMTKAGSGVKNMRKQRTWTDRMFEEFERVTGEQHPVVKAAQERDGG